MVKGVEANQSCESFMTVGTAPTGLAHSIAADASTTASSAAESEDDDGDSSDSSGSSDDDDDEPYNPFSFPCSATSPPSPELSVSHCVYRLAFSVLHSLLWLLAFPVCFLLWITIPECTTPQHRWRYPLTFGLCVLWIGIALHL
jgi:hypothetical protein